MRSVEIFLGFLFLIFPCFSSAQSVDMQELGSVKVNETSIGALIVRRFDSEILLASISGLGGQKKYIPLIIALDGHKISAMRINVFASESSDRVWIYFRELNKSGAKGFLAYYVLGSEEALTLMGKKQLLDTPTPSRISVSPQKIRGFRGEKVKSLATFYLSG